MLVAPVIWGCWAGGWGRVVAACVYYHDCYGIVLACGRLRSLTQSPETQEQSYNILA